MTTTIGIVGTGVIGTGWTVRVLGRGYSVVAFDPAEGAEDRLHADVKRAWPAAAKLGLFPDADPSRVTWASTVMEVAESADFIQESVPEDPTIKGPIHLALDEVADPKVIIASSSSGLLPSEMQATLNHATRFVVGHPFNPVYLLPLVEVVAGKSTSTETVEQAVDHYLDLGMHPLVVRNEIEGYLSDRLQEAMWREILHLVNDGVATTEELDEAIIYGPGLRWAAMGTNLTFYLGGGAGGMRHMLEQFGPALDLPWTHLKAPKLTAQLIDQLVNGTALQAAGKSIEDLERLRDDYLISVMTALRAHDIGAGTVIAAHEERILTSTATKWSVGDEVPIPLHLYSTQVEPDWVDYNGHMTESAFLVAAGWASDALFRYVGIDKRYRDSGNAFYTVETHINFQKEVKVGEHLDVQTVVLGVDHKRLHFIHLIGDVETGTTACLVEQMLVHVDNIQGKSAPIRPEVRTTLAVVADAHDGIELNHDLAMEIP